MIMTLGTSISLHFWKNTIVTTQQVLFFFFLKDIYRIGNKRQMSMSMLMMTMTMTKIIEWKLCF